MGLLAVIIKELNLLMRDKIGLLILFILPLFLLILVSLTQHSVNEPTSVLKVLLVNKDKGKIGREVEKHITTKSDFAVTVYKKSEHSAKEEVAKGKYNALIIINKDLTKMVEKNMRALSENPKRAKLTLNPVVIYADPALPDTIVKSLDSGLNALLQSIQLQATQNTLLRAEHIGGEVKIKKWFEVKQKYAFGEIGIPPNSVQQNVPAWTLFGMFFIVIPLAGQMVRERAMGVMQRILIAPVSQVMHLIGRVVCYLVLTMVQLSLMLLVGVYVLPHVGLPALNVSDNLFLIYTVGVCAALAAIGFGLFIGMYANSLAQATVAAPFIIIIAAAVSGIFVPMALMPKALVLFSEWSPMYWAQAAYLDIFVRNANFAQLIPNLLKLLGFFVVTLLLALLPFTRFFKQRKVK